MKKLKKLLIAMGLGGVVYWIARKRGSGDEFQFSEYPPDGER